jgi:trk system potassium uptake protein TrkH
MGGCLLHCLCHLRDGSIPPFVDCIFTSTSAVCVTGLTTLNTVSIELFW